MPALPSSPGMPSVVVDPHRVTPGATTTRPTPTPSPTWGQPQSGTYLAHCRGTSTRGEDPEPIPWSEVFRIDPARRTVDGVSVQAWDSVIVWRTMWGELHLERPARQLWSEPLARSDRMVDAHVRATCRSSTSSD